MSEWKEWNGRDEQIAEIKNTKNGYIVRRKSGEEVCFLSIEYKCRYDDVVSYWIIPDDPLREMKIRQALTGQPVWMRRPTWLNEPNNKGHRWIYHEPTCKPIWDLPDTEYSFTEFKEEV